MQETEVYDAVYSKLNELTGMDGLRDHQPTAEIVENDHFMLNLLNLEDLGEVGCRTYTREGVIPDETVTEFVARGWRWFFSINIYSKYPTDAARVIQNAFRQEGNPLNPLVIDSMSIIRRIPELVQQRFEGRSQFDLYLSGIVKDGLVIDAIDTGVVIVSGKEGILRPDSITPNNCEQMATAVYQR